MDEAAGSTVDDESTDGIKMLTIRRLLAEVEDVETEIVMKVKQEFREEEGVFVEMPGRAELVERRTGERSDLRFLTEDKVREFKGIINSTTDLPNPDMEEGKTLIESRIEALEKEKEHWRLKALRETDEEKQNTYVKISKLAEMKADYLRMILNERPVSDEVINVTEDNDLTRLEKFKKWARDNMLGLSVVAITIAGIITTVVIWAKGTVEGTAKATRSLARRVSNLSKRLGAISAPLLGVLATALSLGSNGISFLAKNLWILAVFLAYFLYNEYNKRNERSKGGHKGN